jgi:hypothetical protein
MQKKTVRITTTGLIIALGLIVVTSTLSLGVLAQTVSPESFIPLVQKENSANQPIPTAQTTPIRPTPQVSGQAFIDGNPVPPTVFEFYRSTGPDVTGRPITDYRFNETRQRYEMLFENMGIYVDVDDPQQTVHIIPLGIIQFIPQSTPELEAAPFIPSVIRMFDVHEAQVNEAFRGEVLDPLNQDIDGNPIRIFENMVMKVELSNPGTLLWERLPEQLGIEAQPAVPRLADPRFSFFATADSPNLGHNVPREFAEYIRANAGLPISGNPITEIFYADATGAVIRQCYEHMCLDYNLLDDAVQVAPLGVEFFKRITQEQDISTDPMAINMLVWEAATSIPQDQTQTIFAYISQGGQPITNVKPVLEITAPDGQRLLYHMPPTDSSGIASIEILPVGAGNGAIIPYEICLLFRDATRFCVSSQYFIWNVP